MTIMSRLIHPTSRGLPCLLRPLIYRPRTSISIVARHSRTRFSMLPRQVRQYSSESENKSACMTVILSYAVSSILTTLGMSYYLSLPDTIPEMQPAEHVSMKTGQTSVLDVYDQPATPQRTRQELARQECLNKYRYPLFKDLKKRCEHFCTQSSVPCALIQEVHAIYAREIGTNTKSLMNSKSGQNETRSTREELRWLAQLDKERRSMFWDLKKRCRNLCSDSSSPCPIWHEVYTIHAREIDAQEAEGGESGLLRRRLECDMWLAREWQNEQS